MELTERTEPRAKAPILPRPAAALCGCLVYAAFFGCLSSMAYLSDLGLLSLAPGLGVLCLLVLLPLPGKVRAPLVSVLLIASLALLWLLPDANEGARLLCNRLFAASEAAQSYRYDYFPLQSADPRTVPAALLFAGLFIGALIGACARIAPSLSCLILVPLFLAMAYLGILPASVWLALCCAATVLGLSFSGKGLPFPARLAILLIGLLVGAAVWLAFPGKHEALSRWEQSARDRLALQTAAWGERSSEEKPDREPDSPKETQAFAQEDEPDEEASDAWKRPASILLFIAILLLLLFAPALWSDRLRKRREKNRAGLADRDDRVRTVSEFLYAVRWLREAGLAAENVPFSACAESIRQADASLGAAYEALIPVWQAAAYSDHPVDGQDAERMKAFREQAQAFVLGKLGFRRRLAVKYLRAL